MTSPLLKYRITELFLILFGKEAPQKKKEFRDKYKVSLRTFERDTACTLTDSYTIDKERLQYYSEYLNMPCESLRHYLHQKLAA